MTIAQKKQFLDRWSGFSSFQLKSQVEIFFNEIRQLSTLDANHGNDVLKELFMRQLGWAELLSGEEKGREAMLWWPLLNKGMFSITQTDHQGIVGSRRWIH